MNRREALKTIGAGALAISGLGAVGGDVVAKTERKPSGWLVQYRAKSVSGTKMCFDLYETDREHISRETEGGIGGIISAKEAAQEAAEWLRRWYPGKVFAVFPVYFNPDQIFERLKGA